MWSKSLHEILFPLFTVSVSCIEMEHNFRNAAVSLARRIIVQFTHSPDLLVCK
jgi:hypothetical protein